MLIVDLCGEVCVIGLDGRSGAIFCLWMLLFDGVGVADAADYLFVLVLKLLDALLELLELFGQVHSLLDAARCHHFAIAPWMLLF